MLKPLDEAQLVVHPSAKKPQSARVTVLQRSADQTQKSIVDHFNPSHGRVNEVAHRKGFFVFSSIIISLT